MTNPESAPLVERLRIIAGNLHAAGFENDEAETIREAIEALTATVWCPAETAPVEWEGMLAWQYSPWDRGVRQVHIPRGYSRSFAHCAGVYFKLIEIPTPPSTEGRER